jgi:hypothetical protein
VFSQGLLTPLFCRVNLPREYAGSFWRVASCVSQSARPDFGQAKKQIRALRVSSVDAFVYVIVQDVLRCFFTRLNQFIFRSRTEACFGLFFVHA